MTDGGPRDASQGTCGDLRHNNNPPCPLALMQTLSRAWHCLSVRRRSVPQAPSPALSSLLYAEGLVPHGPFQSMPHGQPGAPVSKLLGGGPQLVRCGPAT